MKLSVAALVARVATILLIVTPSAWSASTDAKHPMDALDASEIQATVDILTSAGVAVPRSATVFMRLNRVTNHTVVDLVAGTFTPPDYETQR